MVIRVATIEDLEQVVQVNLRFAYEPCSDKSPSEAEANEKATRLFFAAHLNSPFSRTWVVEINHNVVAVGTLLLFVQPSVAGKVPGIEAYFSNLYTLPEHRRCGYATEIVAAAKFYAQQLGLTKIWLHATEAGRTVYEAAGFQTAAA